MQIHELPSGTPTDADLLPFDTGSVNYKTPFSGFDLKENTATFTSADEADPAQFKTVDPIETGPIKTVLNRLSMAVSNIRYIWKVLSGVNAKTQIINYNDATGQFSIYYDENHQFVFNRGISGSYELLKVNLGNMAFSANETFGELDMRVSNGILHRLYISDGGNPSYPEHMVLRCGDAFIERPTTLPHRLNLVAGDTSYISIGSNADETEGRIYLVCPGGLVVNGNLGWSGTFKDQTGKTVTVHNGIISSVS